MEAGEKLLLPEVWMEVLNFLPVKDLCNMSLVSWDMMDLCSRPKLWGKSNIKKIKFRNGDVNQYFKIRKFRKVKRLDFSRIPLTLENVQQILNHSITTDLCEIDLQGINLSEISPELVSKSLQPLQKVDLTFTKLTTDQSEHLFSYLENNQPTRMKEISFKAINLSTINPSLLASTIARMEKVNLSFTELNTDQLTALVDKIVTQTNDVNLKTIEFFSVDLSGTSPSLLGKALGYLECVNLSNTELRFEHIQSIFEEIQRSKTLKDVNLDFSELFYISDNLFAKSLIRLEKVSLACTVMDVEQLETLFELISKESKIKDLDLLDTDLTGLGAEMMGSAINKLEKVNLSGTKLTGEQLNPMVQQFDFIVLKDLNLDYLDLSKVSIDNICKLLKQLEKISLKKSSLTIEQINSCLGVIASNENVNLKDLNLHGNNLKEVSSSELKDAATHLTSIDLSHTNIPPEVTQKVFEAVSNCKSSMALRNLVLVGSDMETLDSKLIVQAMSKLEKLDLSNSGLSTHQLNTVLSAVAHPMKELSLFNTKMENVDQAILEKAKDVAFINYRYQNN